MTKDEFVQYLEDIGFNVRKDYISDDKEIITLPGFYHLTISNYPKYCKYTAVGVCKNKDGKWEQYSWEDEREPVWRTDIYDTEEECFNSLKDEIPNILADRGLKGIFKNKSYEITKQEIIDYIIKEYQLTQHQADMYYNKIKQSLFILMEFKYYIKTKSFLNEAYDCYGITAEKLVNEYGRLPLEAFTYIISLMNKSEEQILKIKSMLKPKT